MHEAKLYRKLGRNKIQCTLCNHQCSILNGKTGICGVRLNSNGWLFSLVYGRPASIQIDPIEKKPLFHFMPGTATLSFGTLGCNLRCDWCQNWEISQLPKITDDDKSRRPSVGIPISVSEQLTSNDYISPKAMITQAKKTNCPSISYTYTEPTIFFEYALATMKFAHEANLKNIWVSNGYFSKECFIEIKPYLNAINVDLKGFNDNIYGKYCGAKIQPVLDNLKRIAKTKHIHLEITTLIIPTINDNSTQLKMIAEFIAKLDPKIPWHLSRFFPCYKMADIPPTPVKTLKKARKIGQKAGLRYVYLGNI